MSGMSRMNPFRAGSNSVNQAREPFRARRYGSLHHLAIGDVRSWPRADMPRKLGMSAIKDRADQGLGSPDFRFAPRRITNTDCSTSAMLVGAPQISQSAEFKALRKPPKAISRQGSVALAGFERWKTAVRLITVAFGFDLRRAAVATFFVSCRRRAIGPGGSDELMLTSSGGAMRSSTETASVGLSLLRAITSRRSAFANTPCELEVPAFGSARGWTAATALCRGALNSMADSAPTPNRITRPNNAVLSIMCLQSELVPLKILRSKKATCWRLPTRLGIICRQG